MAPGPIAVLVAVAEWTRDDCVAPTFGEARYVRVDVVVPEGEDHVPSSNLVVLIAGFGSCRSFARRSKGCRGARASSERDHLTGPGRHTKTS